MDRRYDTIKLKNMSSDSDKRLALKIQLLIRNKVLNTKCDRNLFFMSSGGKLKSIGMLIENLKKVINFTEVVRNSEITPNDFPLTVSSSLLCKQKKYFNE